MTEAFVVGLASNYVASAMANVCTEVFKEWRRGGEPLQPIDQEYIRDVVDSALGSIRPAALLPAVAERGDELAITRFLTGHDLANVTADAVALHIVGVSTAASSDLHDECRTLLRAHGMSDTCARFAATAVVGLATSIAAECVEVLRPPEKAQDGTDRARQAFEARRAAYGQLRERQVRRLSEQLSTLINLVQRDGFDLPRLIGKLDRLRIAVSNHHSTITPPSLDDARRVPIDSIYVPPRLGVRAASARAAVGRQHEATAEAPRTYSVQRDLPRLLQQHKRLVVLGNPGAGKSTLAQYVALRVSNEPACGECEAVLPIVLREHAATQRGIDVIQAARHAALDRYQVDLSRPEIEFLCTTGRLMLIFDGLDELLELGTRVAVRDSIEAFSAIYKRCTVLLTSRSVGYSQAPMDQESFAASSVEPFSPREVREYVTRWFALHDELAPFQRDTLVASFLEEAEAVRELQENPLLLSLLCGLYRHQRYIPRNRPQIYANCSQLLFDTWDRRRRLRPPFEFDAHVDGAVQYIAWWIFVDQDRQAGVPAPDLQDAAADYFHEWQYRSRAEASAAAREFIDFCKGRAWILTDTGTTGDGTPLFQFTHRTFLEYFTAVYLTRKLSEAELQRLVERRAQESSWSMVCQMLIQLAPKRRHGLEDEILAGLCRRIPGMSGANRELAALVCTESLAVVPLTPASVERVATVSLGLHLDGIAAVGSGAVDRSQFWLRAADIAVENRRAAEQSVRGFFEGVLPGGRIREYAAHVFGFFFDNEVSPQRMAEQFSDPGRRGVVEQLRAGWEPWLDCVSLIGGFGAAVPGQPLRTMGPDFPIRAAPVELPWLHLRAPNLLEIVVWYARHASSDAEHEYLRLVLLPRAKAIFKHFRNRPSVVGGYSPHPCWYWRGQEAGEGAGPTAALPEQVARGGIAAALLLIEWYVELDQGESRRLAEDLCTWNWGALRLVGPAVALRYLAPAGHPAREAEALEALGFGPWCRPDGRRRSVLDLGLN